MLCFTLSHCTQSPPFHFGSAVLGSLSTVLYVSFFPVKRKPDEPPPSYGIHVFLIAAGFATMIGGMLGYSVAHSAPMVLF